MTKSQFVACNNAFYAEIREKKGEFGNPNVVLYLKNGKSVQYNPTGNVHVNKNSLSVSGQEVPFTEIRGVNFYFDKESDLAVKMNKTIDIANNHIEIPACM